MNGYKEPKEDVVMSEVKHSQNTRKRKAPAVIPTKGKKSTKEAETISNKDKKSTKQAASKAKSKKVSQVKSKATPGSVFVIGENSCGQLGLSEDVELKKRPFLLENLPHSIIDICAGGMHSMCLTESGEVFTFGNNDEGALGRDTSEEGSEYIPVKINIPERITQISAGDSHSAALSNSGHVYIWGNFRDGTGALGLVRPGLKQNTPCRILPNINAVKIASGSDHFVCLADNGSVYTLGSGEAGQLGRISQRRLLSAGARGTNALLTPSLVQTRKRVENIGAGSYATYLLLQHSKSALGFGLNNYHQLGLEHPEERYFMPVSVPSLNNITRWSQLKGGQHHALALDDEGLVYSFGRHHYGRLGLGEEIDVTQVPTQIPSLEDNRCIDISCGNCVSFAVTDQGSVYSWGMGDNCQLGHGTQTDKYIPTLIEGEFAKSWKAIKVSGGGQHTLILAHRR